MSKDELLEKLIECINYYAKSGYGECDADALLDNMLDFVKFYQESLDKQK